MERESRPTNIASELMAQRLPDEETERSLSAQIREIRPITRNNRTYHVLEFVPLSGGAPRSVNVFNPHQIESLQPGMSVDITLVRKNNFWNLGTVKIADHQSNTPPAPPSSENKPSGSPTTAGFSSSYNPKDLDPREYRIMSMNALSNAVNFVAAFKELLKPSNADEALALVDQYRLQMLEMHDPNYGHRTGESQ
jgi:hypothetical protein